MILRVHLATVMVATSYITLGVFDSSDAERLWLPYALVTLVLAVVGILDGLRGRRGR